MQTLTLLITSAEVIAEHNEGDFIVQQKFFAQCRKKKLYSPGWACGGQYNLIFTFHLKF